MLVGCVDNRLSSNNAQFQKEYFPQHYKNLLMDNTFSVSAGNYKVVSISLNPKDKNNYVVYGILTETAEKTDGVRFYIVSPNNITYIDTRKKVRSYFFSFRPMETGDYKFYMDNRYTYLVNKLPRLKVYEEYDK